MNNFTHSQRITIHTDGACSGNPGPGGWGAVVCYWHGDALHERLELSGGETSTTNNRMELSAACSALAYVLEMAALAEAIGVSEARGGFDTQTPITLYSDSEYVVKGFSERLQGWKVRHWRGAGGLPAKNRDLWEELDAIATASPITFQWVRGHIGDSENEVADAIARAAIPATP